MNPIDLELPRRALVLHVLLAGLAAVGLMFLFPPSGGRDQAALVLPALTVLLALGTIIAVHRLVDEARDEGRSATITDPDTGVATAQAGEEALRREFNAAQRGRRLTVVLFRVEDLGRYRAVHGRVLADQLLRNVGRTLARNRRGMHVVAERPDEPGTFISILAGVDVDGASVYAKRVQRQLLQLGGHPEPAGISVGVAPFDLTMESPDDLLRRAAFAMRKGAGSGRVVAVGQLAGSEGGGASRYF